MRTAKLIAVLAGALAAVSPGCSSMKTLFAVDRPAGKQGPIQNPFGDYYAGELGNKDNIVLRTKKGDRSVEIELPGQAGAMTDFAIPMSPAFREDGRQPASAGEAGADDKYKDRGPSMTDREILASMPSNSPENDGNRREVETSLGLTAAADETPSSDKSYLAALDHIKQLYRYARYEAGLLEIDEMLRLYPTDPKLYQMRGTLLDRTGRTELALKSWNQALRLDPSNQSLRKFVERKQQKRSIASP